MAKFIYKIEDKEVSAEIYHNIANYLFANAIDEEGKIKWLFEDYTKRYIDENGNKVVEYELQFDGYRDLRKLFFDIINKVDLSALFEPVHKVTE